jgi:hypothetical protein
MDYDILSRSWITFHLGGGPSQALLWGAQHPVQSSGEFINFIYYGKDDASSSVSDVGRHVITRRLLDSIFNILLVFVSRCEMQTFLHRTFLPPGCLHKVCTYPGSQERSDGSGTLSLAWEVVGPLHRLLPWRSRRACMPFRFKEAIQKAVRKKMRGRKLTPWSWVLEEPPVA